MNKARGTLFFATAALRQPPTTLPSTYPSPIPPREKSAEPSSTPSTPTTTIVKSAPSTPAQTALKAKLNQLNHEIAECAGAIQTDKIQSKLRSLMAGKKKTERNGSDYYLYN